MSFKNYKSLDVWKKSHDLVIKLYKITEKFPKEEKYRIIDQLLRAAISIPTNIAEGNGRSTSKDKIHFMIISRGSLTEVDYLLELSKDLMLISNEEYSILQNEISEIGKMLNAFINYLRKNS